MHQHVSAHFSSVLLDVSIQVTSVPNDVDILASVYLDGALQFSQNIRAHAGDELATLYLGQFSIKSPELWWPAGHGKAHLYELTVKYKPTTSQSEEHTQSLSRKIGIRTVELVQDPVEQTVNTEKVSVTVEGIGRHTSAQQARNDLSARQLYSVSPTNFYIRVNGVPIYAKGANFIPMDTLPTRVNSHDRKYILETAIASNMNMIRVWGGGMYQTDDFYEQADQLGLMVWQEIMLACALYPTNSAFLDNIRAEVVEQTSRLAIHPSIVVWGGNNENEVALGWFAESQTNRDLYVADYSKLYGGTIYPAIISVDGTDQRIWVDSSPSNGLISSPDPYAK